MDEPRRSRSIRPRRRLGRTILILALATSSLFGPGARPAGATPTDEFIRAVYEDFLLDTPTADELTWWNAYLGTYSRASMVANVLGSADFELLWVSGVRQYYLGGVSIDDPSFVADLSALASSGNFVAAEVSVVAGSSFYAAAGGTNGGYVDSVFAKVLQRPPSPSDRTYWVSELNAGHRSRANVAQAIIRTLESAQRRVGGPSGASGCAATVLDDEAALSAGSYCIILDRLAAAGDIGYWAAYLTSSSSQLPALWASLGGSSEYFALAQS